MRFKEVHARDFGITFLQFFEMIQNPWLSFRFFDSDECLFYLRGFRFENKIFFTTGVMEQINQLLIREPFKTIDTHHHCFPLRLLHFLRQPLKGLYAFIALREHIDACLRGDGPQSLKPPPERHTAARRGLCRQRIGKHYPRHKLRSYYIYYTKWL